MSLAMLLAGPCEMTPAAMAAARKHIVMFDKSPAAPKAPEVSRTDEARAKVRGYLPEMPDGLSAEDIAHWLDLPPVTVGKVLKELKNDGLVCDSRPGNESRRWFVRGVRKGSDVQPSVPGVLRAPAEECAAGEAPAGNGVGGDRADAGAESRGGSGAAERVVMLEALIKEFVRTRRLTDKKSREACGRAWSQMVEISEGRL